MNMLQTGGLFAFNTATELRDYCPAAHGRISFVLPGNELCVKKPTHLLRTGVDLNTIRAWLGHGSLGTSNNYAETDLAMKTKALAACDSGGGNRRRKKRRQDDPTIMDFLHRL
jgi:hypothetical protein